MTDALADVRRRLPAATARDETLAAVIRRRSPMSGSRGLLDAVGRISAEVVGAGPLEPLLRMPDVSDVLVNGPGPAWIDRGQGLARSDVVIADEQSLRRLAQRLVGACGRRLDDAVPYADARLADGTRVHAVLPPISPQGTCLSLRVPPKRTFSLAQLVAAGSLPAAGAEVLRRLVEARLSFVISGGTGSGKTTVLSTLLSLVNPVERLLVVEDALELRPTHPHVVRLESRLANAEGAGGIALDVLVRQALRMRPDRLVVGEVRGREVVDLLAALNTGHEGGCGTIHANRADAVPARFEALGAAAGLGRDAVHAQLAAAVRAVVHVCRHRDGGRRIVGVAALSTGSDGLVTAIAAYRFERDRVERGPGADLLDRVMA